MPAPVGIVVLVDGEQYQTVPTAGDLARLERHFGITASGLSTESMSVEHVLFLAWNGMRRQGLGPEMTFDEFLDRADTADDDGADAGNPPQPLPKPSV
jgi:hypothetical protein